eukprot:CAMPEP_0119494326 /NCGR_PEP_ID=MMETSP1344-20130328/18314_1 /TAXON_ID=236787 /ORGANISM="Florenciella parvula, Strain CCMP2471" /LENGTH=178 /DNA_ID=CAMNT_0007529819 /DNA_START=1 /DNA_END=534 /DNA_ORIENTATION=+
MNLPKYIDEPQVLRLLAPFGDTKAFNMHKDEKGKSKGTIVFEYDDPEITTGALSSLNGLMLGEIRLLFQRVPPEMAATLLRSTDQAKKMDEAEQAAKKRAEESKRAAIEAKAAEAAAAVIPAPAPVVLAPTEPTPADEAKVEEEAETEAKEEEYEPAADATTVVVLSNVVTDADLASD